MSRTATTNLGLGQYDDGDDPGAGTKGVSVASGGVGLNANWVTLDNAVGTEHNADGTHKANKIKGSNLVQSGGDSCVDGTTLEFSSNQIRIKDLGVSTAKINTDAVDKTKLAADCAGTGLDQDADGSLMVHVDATTIDIVTDALVVQTDGLPFIETVYSSVAEAGSATGNAPTDLTWVQSDNVYTAKIHTFFSKKSHHKYLKLKAAAKTSDAGYAWYIKVLVYEGISLINETTDYGVNTTFDSYNIPECEISVDVSGGTNNSTLKVIVQLMANKATGVTATMEKVTIYTTTL